jgi:succinate-acetate transporter protein
MDGASGQTGRKKNRTSTFVLAAFISFGLFNVFHLGIQVPACNMISTIKLRPLGRNGVT